jgi:DNA-binding SARP family transcriptional activator/ABC-type branched-subunit amino acid transport system substrate-binding protein/streptogramin lyase
MDYRLLGPLEVLDGGRPVDIPPGKPRALLALLLVHANEVVSTDRIVEALWNGRPPPTAGKIVQNAISQLRKSLTETRHDSVLLRRGQGYVLLVEPGERDVDRFAALLADGRASLAEGEPARAEARFRDALALWRGPALAEFSYEGFAQSEIAELEELRATALEELAEALLALGRQDEVVPHLERLVREHPLRERPRGQLMLALYRSGRQADALQVFADTRRVLLDELGIEPGRPLQELQRAILEQDPALDAPPPQANVRRRRLGLVAAAAAGLAAIAIATGLALFQSAGNDEGPALDAVAPNTVAIVEPASGRLTGQVRVPGGPRLVGARGRDVWIENDLSRTLTALDERTGEVRRIVVPEVEAADMVVGPDALWLVDRLGRELVEIDPAYGQVARRIRLPRPSGRQVPRTAPAIPSVAAAGEAVWVTDGSTRLLRVDTRTGDVDSVDAGVGLDGVAARNGRVWAISGPSAVALEIAPASGQVRSRVPIAGRTGALAPFPTTVGIGESAVWVLNANTANVTKIDPELSAVVATFGLGVDRAPVDLAVGAGAVWTVNRGDGTLSRIDARTGATTTIHLGQDPASVTVGPTRVWASVRRGLVGKVAGPTAAVGTAGALPKSLCSSVHYPGPGAPDLLVAVPLSLQGFAAQASAQMTAGVRLVFERRGWRAGRHTVGFQACNDAERASGFPTPERCAANARTYVTRRRVVGVVGPVYSGCSQVMLPILNAAPGGPVAVANGLNTYVGLTRSSTLVPADEPAKYYPSGRRSYVRVTAGDDVQAAGAAAFMSTTGVRRVFLLHDESDYGSTLSRAFAWAAQRAGLDVTGSAQWRQGARAYTALAQRVRASRADGVYLAGTFRIGSSLLVDLRQALGPDAILLGADGFQIVLKELGNLGREIEGLYISALGVPLAQLGPTGRRYVRDLTERIGRSPELFTVETAAAAEVLLDAISRSDGTRASVSKELLSTKLGSAILGPVSFTASGDVRRSAVTISRIVHGRVIVADVSDPPVRLFASG